MLKLMARKHEWGAPVNLGTILTQNMMKSLCLWTMTVKPYILALTGITRWVVLIYLNL